MAYDLSVKELRKSLKMTQKEFADKCGVSPRTIQYWEKTGNIPGPSAELMRSFNEEKDANIACDKKNGKTKSEIYLLIEELSEQRKLTQKSQEQIDKLLIIIDKLSTK